MQTRDVTGTPNWPQAREAAQRLREMPQYRPEANVQHELAQILRALFPRLPASEMSLQKQTGDGPADIYCRNVIFETKKQGKLDARRKPDGSTETPEEQAVRYLDALTAHPDMFAKHGHGWRAGVADGKEWRFYRYNRDKPQNERLALVRELTLADPSDDEALVSFLYDFVERTVKLSPPTSDAEWAEKMARPFINLAISIADKGSPAYDVKLKLWRDLLRGAYITPPKANSPEETNLFARHTMLVVMARAVAETILPPTGQPLDRERLHESLTRGFAAWLLDAASDSGESVLDETIDEVNCYEWQSGDRDTLKDLYHAVIPRNLRHDFGEYYTPDWLARAICEEVMDAKWRKNVIDLTIARKHAGPAALDPSCGSGTFIYHATQLLLNDARKRPEFDNNPYDIVETVNGLVAGIDLHPVAVELATTTKVLAFSDLA